MAVTGRIQTGSYTNRDGVKVYTTEVVVEDQEFAESKNASGGGNGGGYNGNGQSGGYQQQGGGQNYGGNQQAPRYNNQQQPPQYGNQQGQQYGGNYGGQQQGYDNLDGFMNIPDGIDEQLPFA